MIAIMWDGHQSYLGNARHRWFEEDGIRIIRPEGIFCYTFLHFHSPTKFLTPDGYIITKPHACIMFAPYVPQEYTAVGPLYHDWAHLDEDSAALWTKAGLEFNTIYYPKSYDFITENMQVIELEDIRKEPGHEAFIDAKLTETFIGIARCLDSSMTSVNKRVMQLLQQTRREMMLSLGEKWTAKRIADAMSISEVYLYSLYKKLYDISPTADIIRARVAAAQLELSNTTRPVADIATSLGYSSTDHFSRQFKQIVGQSPYAYRKRTRQQ